MNKKQRTLLLVQTQESHSHNPRPEHNVVLSWPDLLQSFSLHVHAPSEFKLQPSVVLQMHLALL